VTLNVVPKAACDSKIVLEASTLYMYTVKNQQMVVKESRSRNSGAAFATFFRLSKCFESRKQRLFIIIFRFPKEA
jgi:hypothetical protein